MNENGNGGRDLSRRKEEKGRERDEKKNNWLLMNKKTRSPFVWNLSPYIGKVKTWNQELEARLEEYD